MHSFGVVCLNNVNKSKCYLPKSLVGFPNPKLPRFSPPPNCGFAWPLFRAKLEVTAGFNPPLLPPTLSPVPTNGVIGIPEFEFGLNWPPTLNVGFIMPLFPTCKKKTSSF